MMRNVQLGATDEDAALGATRPSVAPQKGDVSTQVAKPSMRWSHLAAAAAAGASIIALGVYVTWAVANQVLIDDARESGLHWAQYLERNMEDLDAVIAGEPISVHDQKILTLASDAGNVYRYHIFDPTGRVMFSSDFLSKGQDVSELVGHSRSDLEPALLDGEIMIELEDGSGSVDGRPDAYAEAYLPLYKDGRIRGVIEVYVDQADKVARYWENIGALLLAMAGLLAIAATVPAVIVRGQYERLRSAEDHIRDLAFRDTLTGLANRRMFKDELDRVAEARQGDGRKSALLMFDLDHFKAVNDTLGHNAGDELLRVTARRIRDALAPGDLLARLGGDEFAIIVADASSVVATEQLAQRVLDAASREAETREGAARVGASIGLAFIPDHGRTSTQIMRNADTALYRAKEAGRGVARHFDPSMQEQTLARRQLEGDLRTAIGDGRIGLHFQPAHDLDSGATPFVEALLCWDHPERGLLEAKSFLPILEGESNLFSAIGDLTIRRAAAALSQLDAAGLGDVAIAINVSNAQLRRDDFADDVVALLADFAVPPSRFIIEIPEDAVFGRHANRAIETAKRLRAAGLKLAIDDFGTGYGSLAQLRGLPIDIVKIDGSFVRGVGQSAHDQATVRAIVTLCRSLGIRVVAEAVETREQQSFLASLGAIVAQGVALDAPMSIEQLVAKRVERSI